MEFMGYGANSWDTLQRQTFAELATWKKHGPYSWMIYPLNMVISAAKQQLPERK
jgi:hypothetical protein